MRDGARSFPQSWPTLARIMVPGDPTVGVRFASFNTRRVSELCLRSMGALAGHDFDLIVGDCDSTDGSLAMLTRYERAGILHVERAVGGRRHGEWLDQWLASATCRYIVFCDSDVEFLRKDWLKQMVARATTSGAALVATRIQALDGVPYVHPTTGAVATLAPRPEPWLMLIDVEQVRGKVDASFLYEERELPDGSKMAYDTAAAFFRELVEQRLSYSEMPAEFAGAFRHYSGLTWQRRDVPLRRRVKQTAKHLWVWTRWQRSRVVHRNAVGSPD